MFLRNIVKDKKNNCFPPRYIVLVLFSLRIMCDNNTAHLTSYGYDDRYKDMALTQNQETAVLIIAYNRPEYLIQCIKSIEQNPESQELIFIFALDGGSQSKQDENIDLINQATIKHKIILRRNRNYGCPKNHIDSQRFAFEWCKFKKVILMQEDIIVTPSYFTFMLNLHAWATNTYDNIAAVQSWTKCYLTAEQKKDRLDHVQEDRQYWSFVTYCLDSICWQEIRSILYGYENFVDQIPHTDEYARARSKPHLWKGADDIRQWAYDIVRSKTQKKVSLPSTLKSATKYLSRLNLCEDEMMGFAFCIKDLVKITSVVNRVRHIGEHGISTNKGQYDRLYQNVHLDLFPEDKIIKTFQLL